MENGKRRASLNGLAHVGARPVQIVDVTVPPVASHWYEQSAAQLLGWDVGWGCPMSLLMSFEVWRALLRADCERNGKLQAFFNLGESVLKVLWEGGAKPSLQGIVETESSIVSEVLGHYPQS